MAHTGMQEVYSERDTPKIKKMFHPYPKLEAVSLILLPRFKVITSTTF